MASNTNRGFFPLSDFEMADTFVAVIGASQTLYVGDALQPGATGHTKAVVPADTSHVIIGVCIAILGVPGGHLPEIGGSLLGGSPGSVTTGSGNETTPVYYARFVPLTMPGIKFSAQLSATAGTTTNSDGMGSFALVNGTSGQLDETSVALFSATEKQFWSYGLDTTDNNKFTVIGSFAKTLTP